MLFRWRKKQKKARFYRLTREIFNTPPMPVVDAPWSIISMVSNTDVQMYLLAMKSFYARLGRGKLVVIVNRDMPGDLRNILAAHFPGIRFVILEDINTGACQRGGTWERLVYLLDHSENEYAIQVDCDTLTFGADVTEIAHCIENNLAFTLSNGGRAIKTMKDAAQEARETDSDYVGIIAERLFDRHPQADTMKYVRGSSGFAGFAKGAFSRAQIEDYHRHMEALLGEDWTRWGSEQCGSNFAVANSANAVVLPYPKYANFWPGLRGPSSFLHFLGTNRYLDDYFALRGQDVINELKGKNAPKMAANT